MWSTSKQGLILGAFYYGYCVTQIPGGFVAERYGGKVPFGLGLGLASAITLLNPIAAKSSYLFLLVLRALQGRDESTEGDRKLNTSSRGFVTDSNYGLLPALSSIQNLPESQVIPALAVFSHHTTVLNIYMYITSAIITPFIAPLLQTDPDPVNPSLLHCQGFVEGVTIPAFYVIASKWMPAQEKSVLMTFVQAGMSG